MLACLLLKSSNMNNQIANLFSNKIMNRDIFSLLLFVFISFLLSGCGVIFGGSRFTASIIAKDHPNAHVYVNGNDIGRGMAIGAFPRSRPLTIELRQKGCEPKTQTFDNKFRTGNFILSLFSWGIVGGLIDLGTGASFKPDHRHNPAIEKITTKNFVFVVDYSGCPTEKEIEE
jgi:hypothetical protein